MNPNKTILEVWVKTSWKFEYDQSSSLRGYITHAPMHAHTHTTFHTHTHDVTHTTTHMPTQQQQQQHTEADSEL